MSSLAIQYYNNDDQCRAILKTGANKGRRCGNYNNDSNNGLCSLHLRSSKKNKVHPLPIMYVVQNIPQIQNIRDMQNMQENTVLGVPFQRKSEEKDRKMETLERIEMALKSETGGKKWKHVCF